MSEQNFAIMPTGDIWFLATNVAMLQAMQRGISPLQLQILTMMGQLDGASFHTKPITDSCEAAVLVRVPNDFAVNGIGTELANECKGRIFAAQDTHGNDVVVANFYMADSKLDFRKLAESLPRNIEIPKSAFHRPKGNFDPMDVMSLDYPYTKASDLLGLGLGQINPFSVVLNAQERGVKLICVYDERLAKQEGYVTNNAARRDLGIFAENAASYIELAISHAQNVEISGREERGYIVADVAERDRNVQAPSALRQLYGAADSFEAALRATMQPTSPAR